MAGYSPWGCEELDTVEQLTISIACTHSRLVIPFPDIITKC